MTILRAFIYCLGVFALTAVISLIVAGFIKLLYKSVHRSEVKTENKNSETKPAA
jgi:uncharacterized protein involved in exopolysaccharide biosynthesis